MAKVIPSQIERDIQSGKAKYRTFQTGVGGQSILSVDPNAYIVIFGYDFAPAGAGFSYSSEFDTGYVRNRAPEQMLPFATQQVSFYTGNDFWPFIHHVPLNASFGFDPEGGVLPFAGWAVDNTNIERQVYIVSSRDVAITVGLIKEFNPVTANAIPVTGRTPQGLTYGGDAQTPATQTDFSSAALNGPVQFMQPSLKDYNDFGFGLLPANASDQAFATPDAVNGLIEPSQYLNTVLSLAPYAAFNYFLNVHYALYTATTPEQL